MRKYYIAKKLFFENFKDLVLDDEDNPEWFEEDQTGELFLPNLSESAYMDADVPEFHELPVYKHFLKEYPTTKEEYAPWLHERLVHNHMAQGELAKNVGVEQKSVSRYENGDSTPQKETELLIAEYFYKISVKKARDFFDFKTTKLGQPWLKYKELQKSISEYRHSFSVKLKEAGKKYFLENIDAICMIEPEFYDALELYEICPYESEKEFFEKLKKYDFELSFYLDPEEFDEDWIFINDVKNGYAKALSLINKDISVKEKEEKYLGDAFSFDEYIEKKERKSKKIVKNERISSKKKDFEDLFEEKYMEMKSPSYEGRLFNSKRNMICALERIGKYKKNVITFSSTDWFIVSKLIKVKYDIFSQQITPTPIQEREAGGFEAYWNMKKNEYYDIIDFRMSKEKEEYLNENDLKSP